MANELDEFTDPTNSVGRDVKVIDKQLNATISQGTQWFERSIWIGGVLLALLIAASISEPNAGFFLIGLCGALPGLFFEYLKAKAREYLGKLQQKIQADASQIDNFLEQRVIILQNLAQLIEKSTKLDSEVMTSIAALRSGKQLTSDQSRSQQSELIDNVSSSLNVAFEAYPNLKSQDNIAEAIRQNAYLQNEITAARTLYNDSVARWNMEIFSWPTKLIVAARAGYTTRIPFTASSETKTAARQTFFQ
jgi:LemA protein